MTADQLASEYLRALESSNLTEILRLFTDDAQVNSPLYGLMSASDFYRQLLEDTNQSKLTLLDVFDQTQGDKIAIHFNYQWTMKDGTLVSFDVVDILELTADKIKMLTIIYDTFHTRSTFENLSN